MIQIINDDCLAYMRSSDFQKVLDNHKVCIVTDPPFNIGYHYNSYKDNLNERDYYEMLEDVFTAYNIPFVVIHYPEVLHMISYVVGRMPDRVVSWVYNSNTPRQHRDIAFYGVSPDFRKVRQPYKNPNDKRIKKLIEQGHTGGKLYDWWNVNQVKNVSKTSINHPCVMPLEVMKNIIGVLPNDYLIFDPFAGSGTTALACREYDRDCIVCEIDKSYCNLIEQRLAV